jgi:triosephosphate isomerase (TIM)
MEPTPLLVASHKLFLGLPQALTFARGLRAALERRTLTLEVVLSPSLLNLAHVAEVLEGSVVGVAAQNVHQEVSGAYTGQVSLQELVDLGVGYVVIGHSEIVACQHDGADTLSDKIRWCVRHGVTPMVCVSDDGTGDETSLRRLLAGSLREESRRAMPLIVYEPPPGTSCDAPDMRQHVREVLRGIREQATALLCRGSAPRPRVLYGGGVNPGNVDTLARELDADGFLVGRSSVELASFLSIVDGFEEATRCRDAVHSSWRVGALSSQARPA